MYLSLTRWSITDISVKIFLLDRREHARDKLFHEKLADAQGPALLAYNSSDFSAADWAAIQSIYKSSKVTDTSYVYNGPIFSPHLIVYPRRKIGKYGVGFRACYHVRLLVSVVVVVLTLIV